MYGRGYVRYRELCMKPNELGKNKKQKESTLKENVARD